MGQVPGDENDRDPAVIFEATKPMIRQIFKAEHAQGNTDICSVLLCDLLDSFGRELFTSLQGKECVDRIERATHGSVPIGALGYTKQEFHLLIDELFDEETTRGIMRLFSGGRTVALIIANNRRAVVLLSEED